MQRVKFDSDSSRFLPMSPEEMRQRGWKQADIILVTADAYVDHPAFGVAMIGRFLEKLGYKIVITASHYSLFFC